MNTIHQIVEKVNDLFVTTRYKHLIQKKDGTYKTSDVNNNELNKAKYGKTFRPDTYLADWKIQEHLDGKRTMGVFGTSFGSKFLTFDVDVEDAPISRWITLKVVNQLVELGVPQDKIYVSSSGNKGYHIDLYFTDILSNAKLNQFYQLVMYECDFTPNKDTNTKEVVRFECESGMVEQRPVGLNQGVKLPLGKHQKSKEKNRCWYVDVFNRFKAYETFDYILEVEKLDVDVIEIILDEQLDLTEEKKQIAELKSYIEKKYTPLPQYEIGVNEEVTIEAYEKLEREGLTRKGTRHNSIFKLARYYKYLGLDATETIDALVHWMSEQDTRMYDTKFDECVKDIRSVVDYVFVNDLTIIVAKDYINVSYKEMVKILQAKSKNQKLLLFAMLVHSKRYADKNGVMYMTYKQMHLTTTLTEKNARINVRKLEEQGLVDIVSTNVIQKGTHIKKPNKYNVKIAEAVVNGSTVEIGINEETEESFNKALVNLIPMDELKKVLPRRHWDEVKKLYVS